MASDDAGESATHETTSAAACDGEMDAPTARENMTSGLATPFHRAKFSRKIDVDALEQANVDSMMHCGDILQILNFVDDCAGGDATPLLANCRGERGQVLLKAFQMSQFAVQYLLHMQENLRETCAAKDSKKDELVRALGRMKRKLADQRRTMSSVRKEKKRNSRLIQKYEAAKRSVEARSAQMKQEAEAEKQRVEREASTDRKLLQKEIQERQRLEGEAALERERLEREVQVERERLHRETIERRRLEIAVKEEKARAEKAVADKDAVTRQASAEKERIEKEAAAEMERLKRVAEVEKRRSQRDAEVEIRRVRIDAEAEKRRLQRDATAEKLKLEKALALEWEERKAALEKERRERETAAAQQNEQRRLAAELEKQERKNEFTTRTQISREQKATSVRREQSGTDVEAKRRHHLAKATAPAPAGENDGATLENETLSKAVAKERKQTDIGKNALSEKGDLDVEAVRKSETIVKEASAERTQLQSLTSAAATDNLQGEAAGASDTATAAADSEHVILPRGSEEARNKRPPEVEAFQEKGVAKACFRHP